MGCACKVNTHINKIEQHYGTKILPSKKTNISNSIKLFFKKCAIGLICLPFTPFIFLFIGARKIITNKPISLDKLIKKTI